MQKILYFLDKLEIGFFYSFLITFTLTIRKVLLFYPIGGQFNEYTGIYLYLSDIFLLLVLVSAGLSILYNKIILKSSSGFSFIAFLKQKLVIIPLLLVIFSLVSAFWSNNWQVAFYRSIKMLEFLLLYLWVIFRLKPMARCSTPVPWQQNVPRGTFCLPLGWNIFRNSIGIVVFTGLFQSIVAIWQFIAQKSIGLIWLRESVLSADISGVAKIVLNGHKYIRAYGLFPHPNILGGFLVLSIILTFTYFKPFNLLRNLENSKNNKEMFHVEHFSTYLCSTWNIYVYYIILAIQIVALVLTFSKSAWIGLGIALLYLWSRKIKDKKEAMSIAEKDFHACLVANKCSTWNICYATGMENIKYFALLAGIVFLTIVIIKPDWYSVVGKGVEDRMFYLNVSRGTFLDNPILGVGIGQYVYQLANITNIQDWQFQPVHNIFLLILNEMGIIGLFLFLWFICETIKNVPRGTFAIYIKAIFSGFLFIMLADHYFWDIQQGQVMIWLVLGIIAGCKMWVSDGLEPYPQVKGDKY